MSVNINELVDQLNPEQKQAVILPAQESGLIVAGAGSGKTKVLTSRVAFLINRANIKPQSILAVTFTNKAAKEMVERLEKIGVSTQGMWVGTFHGICNRFLRIFHEKAGLPNSFNIMDVDDSKLLIKRIIQKMQEDKVLSAFGSGSDAKAKEKAFLNECASKIGRWKEQGLRSHQIVLPKTTAAEEAAILKVYKEYEYQCQWTGSVDFAELLLKTVELMEQDTVCLQWMQNKFQNILVDEFQDTNGLQYRWIKRLASMPDGKKKAVFAVGDGDQSIYGFRGAVVENLNSFKVDFNLSDHQIIKLEQNYRSVGAILKAANSVIEKNQNRLAKNLWTQKGDGRHVHEIKVWDERDEGFWVAQEMKKAHKIKTKPFHEMAVLYRTNAQSRAIEQSLVAAGIPYRITGGLKFYERAEIKNALAYLKLIGNPNDTLSMLRCINTPSRGLGEKTIEKWIHQAKEENKNLMDFLKEVAQKEKGKAIEGLKQWLVIMDNLSLSAKTNTLIELMEFCAESTGLMNYYKDEPERQENLKELMNAAAQFIQEASIDQGVGLEDFLANATLAVAEAGAKENESAVQLMTVHASKGLEFKDVYVVGLEEGVFPSARSKDEDNDGEEERRLMYVAMTRAKEELNLLHAKNRFQFGKSQRMLRSSFLKEINQQYVEIKESELFQKESQQFEESQSYGSESYGYKKDSSRYGEKKYKKEDDIWQDRGLSNQIAQKWEHKEKEDGLSVGVKVNHPRFGDGVIQKRKGKDNDESIEVLFEDGGSREMSLNIVKSKLTILQKKPKMK